MISKTYRVLAAGSLLGEIVHAAGATEFRVAGPAGEAWMTLIRELVESKDLVVLLPGNRIGQGPHDRDVEQLEAALELATRSYPVTVEGLAPRPPSPPDPAVDVALEQLRGAVQEVLRRRQASGEAESTLARWMRATPATGDGSTLGRCLDELFEAGRRGDEPLRLVIDAATVLLRAPGVDPALENFARQWTRFRVERPERTY